MLLNKIIQKCSDPANKNALICTLEEKTELARFTANLLLRNKWSIKKQEMESLPTKIIDNFKIFAIDQLLAVNFILVPEEGYFIISSFPVNCKTCDKEMDLHIPKLSTCQFIHAML